MRLCLICMASLVVACASSGTSRSPASAKNALPDLWAPLFVDHKQWTMPLKTFHPDQPAQEGTITCRVDGVVPLEDQGYASILVCRTDRGLILQTIGRSLEGTRSGLWSHGGTNEAKHLPQEEVLLTIPPKPRQFERVIHDGSERFDVRARGQDWCITNLHKDQFIGVRERVLCIRPGVGVVGGRESTPMDDPTHAKSGSAWGTEL